MACSTDDKEKDGANAVFSMRKIALTRSPVVDSTEAFGVHDAGNVPRRLSRFFSGSAVQHESYPAPRQQQVVVTLIENTIHRKLAERGRGHGGRRNQAAIDQGSKKAK